MTSRQDWKQYLIKNRKIENGQMYIDIHQVDNKQLVIFHLYRSMKRLLGYFDEKLYGCSKSELLEHIEKKFYSNITWENYDRTWIITCKFSEDASEPITKEDIIKSYHYENINPTLHSDC